MRWDSNVPLLSHKSTSDCLWTDQKQHWTSTVHLIHVTPNVCTWMYNEPRYTHTWKKITIGIAKVMDPVLFRLTKTQNQSSRIDLLLGISKMRSRRSPVHIWDNSNWSSHLIDPEHLSDNSPSRFVVHSTGLSRSDREFYSVVVTQTTNLSICLLGSSGGNTTPSQRYKDGDFDHANCNVWLQHQSLSVLHRRAIESAFVNFNSAGTDRLQWSAFTLYSVACN